MTNKIYRIKTISGECFWITEEEYTSLTNALNLELQTITLGRLGATINPKCIETIVDCNHIDRSNLKEGYLHDGTKIVKQYGSWRYVLDPDRVVNPSDYPADGDVYSSLEELRVDKDHLLK